MIEAPSLWVTIALFSVEVSFVISTLVTAKSHAISTARNPGLKGVLIKQVYCRQIQADVGGLKLVTQQCIGERLESSLGRHQALCAL